jgi:hypothetical protein
MGSRVIKSLSRRVRKAANGNTEAGIVDKIAVTPIAG